MSFKQVVRISKSWIACGNDQGPRNCGNRRVIPHPAQQLRGSHLLLQLIGRRQDVVRALIARGLDAEEDRDKTTGAGLLSTTSRFLERLGLASLDDLPPIASQLPEAADLADEIVCLGNYP